jgi:hypothetical protein
MIDYTQAEALVTKLVQALEHGGLNSAKKIAPDAPEKVHDELTQAYATAALKAFFTYTLTEMNDEDVAAIAKRIDRHCDNLYKLD